MDEENGSRRSRSTDADGTLTYKKKL
ncbi:uncharacterized protein G2W53_042442 [Senna tora]|uniref:Uncharacterized protein n=1 Tax=Senna tora TaxID=362788 RepID=A0A834W2E5_9FABA|nr:uncharacterized protein G2W53_042442 [Senna tora]